MVAALCQPCFSEKNSKQPAYTVDALFRNFSKDKKVSRENTGNFILSIAHSFSDTKGITEAELLSFAKCDNSVKEKLNDAIKNMKDISYEIIFSTTQDNVRIKVLVKVKDEYMN